MRQKMIVNHCETGDRCILQIDEKYFGYDNHPQCPEALFKDVKKAYVFNSQRDALSVTTFMSGDVFTLLPFKEKGGSNYERNV